MRNNSALELVDIVTPDELESLEPLLAIYRKPVEANWHNEAILSAFLQGKMVSENK